MTLEVTQIVSSLGSPIGWWSEISKLLWPIPTPRWKWWVWKCQIISTRDWILSTWESLEARQLELSKVLQMGSLNTPDGPLWLTSSNQIDLYLLQSLQPKRVSSIEMSDILSLWLSIVIFHKVVISSSHFLRTIIWISPHQLSMSPMLAYLPSQPPAQSQWEYWRQMSKLRISPSWLPIPPLPFRSGE